MLYRLPQALTCAQAHQFQNIAQLLPGLSPSSLRKGALFILALGPIGWGSTCERLEVDRWTLANLPSPALSPAQRCSCGSRSHSSPTAENTGSHCQESRLTKRGFPQMQRLTEQKSSLHSRWRVWAEGLGSAPEASRAGQVKECSKAPR